MAKPKLSLVCIGCGAEFERLASELRNKDGAGKYCTRECRDEHWKGELNPNWQDGSGVYKRGPRWQSIKRAILKRDNHECKECGADGELHVHHKVPFRMFDDPDIANHENNLISLCPPCHRREDAKWKWVKIGDAIIRMASGSYGWQLAKELIANDNRMKLEAA